jgi:hypothetical protein
MTILEISCQLKERLLNPRNPQRTCQKHSRNFDDHMQLYFYNRSRSCLTSSRIQHQHYCFTTSPGLHALRLPSLHSCARAPDTACLSPGGCRIGRTSLSNTTRTIRKSSSMFERQCAAKVNDLQTLSGSCQSAGKERYVEGTRKSCNGLGH